MNTQALTESLRATLLQFISTFTDIFTNTEILVYVCNTLFFVSLIFAVMTVTIIRSENRQENLIYQKVGPNQKEFKNPLKDVLFKELYTNLGDIMKDKGKEPEKGDTIALIIIFVCLIIGVFMAVVKQILFAIVLPLAILFAAGKVTGMMKKSTDDYIQEQLPMAIDNIIRTFTKYNDLRSILFESTTTLKDPMQTMFRRLSGRMLNESPNIVLDDFADQTNNIWINSLCFILTNYLGTTPKKEVIENLRNLRDIINRDNKNRKKEQLERKMTIMINFVLCGVSVAGFIGNILVNPMGKDFFFSTVLGLGCFVLGFALLIIAIFSNLLIGNRK